MADRAVQRRLRWYQFRLRTLLAAMTLIVATLGAGHWYLTPYRQQGRTMDVIKGLGGSFETAQASRWHRLLLGSGHQNLVLADVADCDDPSAYLSHIERLPFLEVLAVGGTAFGDEELGRLQRVRTLRFLVLDGTGVSEAAVADLCGALPELEVYRSQRRTIAELKKQIQHVRTEPARSPNELGSTLNPALFHKATGVWAENQAVPDDALRRIASLETLTRVDFNGTDMTDERVEQLRGLTNLQELLISRTQVTDAGLNHIGRLGTLRLLWLDRTGVTDEGLAELTSLPKLDRLSLARTRITDAGLAHLKRIKSLSSVYLPHTQVSDAGVVHLRELPKLRDVTLRGTRVTDAGLVHLKGLPKLVCIVLRDTQVTDEGLKRLEGERGLWTIDLTGTEVTEEGVKRFKKALPTCLVFHAKFGTDPGNGPLGSKDED